MESFPIFLSVVCSVRNQAELLEEILTEISATSSRLVSDFEIIVVDNASDDNSITALQRLTGESGLPNLQVFALTKEVDADTASLVGLENALGDFVVLMDPLADSITFLPQMLERAVGGADVVVAGNQQKAPQGLAYRAAFQVFNFLYKWFNGIHLTREIPRYRVISKKVVSFILRHPQPALTYRHLLASGGFAKVNLTYSARPRRLQSRRLGDSIDQGIRLLVSTTRAPMRLVTSLSLFGAVANILYSIYVVSVALFKADVAPGWVSLSLQQSGMFFLISLVLLVLGEYILQMASLSGEGPQYHIAQEFTSARMIHREKLNVEEAVSAPHRLAAAIGPRAGE